MYKCKDCEKIFKYPKKVVEKHGLPEGPYEILMLCPLCGSHNFVKKREFYCKYCGAKLSKDADYCSASCRKRGEEAYAREAERRRQLAQNPIVLAVREVEEYNKTHNQKISYGEYFARRR